MLRRRAQIHRGRMLRAQLDRLRGHREVCAAGVSGAERYGLDLRVSRDEVELYLPRRLLDELRRIRAVKLSAPDPNVILRVPALDERIGVGGPVPGAGDAVEPSAIVGQEPAT